MQHLTVGTGSPEESLYFALRCQLSEFVFNRPNWNGTYHSHARMPDPQAAAERCSSVLFQALIGKRVFRGAGQLCADEVFSPQQLIIDKEILEYVKRFIRGFDLLAGDDDVVAEIQVGLDVGGNFMTADGTLDNYRDFCFFPELFQHYNVGHWQSIGSPTVLEESWKTAKDLLDNYNFCLPDDQTQELERVYQKALKVMK